MYTVLKLTNKYSLIIITIITTIIIIISFMQGIYTHIPETNYVPRATVPNLFDSRSPF